MSTTKSARSLAIVCAAALAAFALPAQAVVTETETGPVSTLLDDFNGGESIFSGQGLAQFADGGDGYIRALDTLSFSFNTDALSSLTLSFSYTACDYNTGTGACPTAGFPSAATVSLTGPGDASLLSTGLAGAAGASPNPGPTVGGQFLSSFSNLLAGDYTLRFAPVGGSVLFKLDDVSLTAVSAVPEPGSVALMLAGLGVIGLAARRRKA